jgi:poly(3-hydroxybutyrate) depolymerase
VLLVLAALTTTACSDSSSSIARNVQTTRCITDVAPSERQEFLCDGVQFKVMLTPECIERACGLIVDVHGWLSNPDEQERRSTLARAAMDNGGYIVIQPGELGTPSDWDPDTHYDVVFEFMQQAMDAYDVDRRRVHFTGFSQGGLMTWQFVCDYPDVIASAAPLSAIEIDCFRNGPGPSRDVPLFFISGVADPLVRYHGPVRALTVPHTLVAVMYDYAMVTVDAADYEYADGSGLLVDPSGRIDAVAPDARFEVVDGSEQGSYLWTRYTNAEGVVFEHLRHDNGHVYPDNPDNPLFPEEPAVWFSVGEAILEFFIANPLR